MTKLTRSRISMMESRRKRRRRRGWVVRVGRLKRMIVRLGILMICMDLICVTTLIPNEYRQSSNSSVSGSLSSRFKDDSECLLLGIV
jgi:hypothetical protein